jgi:hypothetical protein
MRAGASPNNIWEAQATCGLGEGTSNKCGVREAGGGKGMDTGCLSGPNGRNLTHSHGRVDWKEFEQEPLKSVDLTELKQQRSEEEVEN